MDRLHMDRNRPSLPPQASSAALARARMKGHTLEQPVGLATRQTAGDACSAWSDPADDPDRLYFARGTDHLDDSEDGSVLSDYGAGDGLGDDNSEAQYDEDDMDSDGVPAQGRREGREDTYQRPQYQYDLVPLGRPEPDSGEEEEDDGPDAQERFEWQHMLENVLQGDVLRSEKTRISTASLSAASLVANLDMAAGRRQRAYAIWLLLRAYVRGRTPEEESRFLEEARNKIDVLMAEVMTFRIPDRPATAADTAHSPEEEQAAYTTAVGLVDSLLRRVEWCASLYPSLRALQLEKPKTGTPEVVRRLDALRSWQSISKRLATTTSLLQKYTGEEWSYLSSPSPPPLLEGQPPRTRAFIDRIVREDRLDGVGQSRLVREDIYHLSSVAKASTAEFAPEFLGMNLPSFASRVLALVVFPSRVAQETLRHRLDGAARVTEPTSVLIEQLTSDLRKGLRAATNSHKAFIAVAAPDEHSGWSLPEVIEGYEQTLLDSLRFFFKLLHWKLKSPNKQIYFKETEVIENEWAFLAPLTEQIEGGDLLVGEHFTTLTHRLLLRIMTYFDMQLQVLETRDMTLQERLRWFNQTLDNVRARHRKLLRFSKSLLTRFENSAEYDLTKVDLGVLIHALIETDHFIIYTGTFEKSGTYMIGDPTLHERPELVRDILSRCYSTHTQADARTAWTADVETNEDATDSYMHYIVLLTPREPFLWSGRVMNLELPRTDFDLREKRLRLVADGPGIRLNRAKRMFCDLFPAFSSLVVVEAKAHLAKVSREIKKIRRTAQKLSESILGAVERVQAVSRRTPGEGQEILENYFTFAADLGQRSIKHLEPAVRVKYSLFLMQFAINWVAFICDDCIPTDPRTFKWAVSALEFAMSVSQGDAILKFSLDQFAMLRNKVASCMTLLMSHFDILGARSTFETKKDLDRMYPSRAETFRQLEERLEALRAPLPDDGERVLDSINPVRHKWVTALAELDVQRREVEQLDRKVGTVLDHSKAEDRGLAFLASQASNISMRWQQGRFIGGGSFGSVYLAVNLDTGQELAVKEIRIQDLASAPHLIETITEEMKVMEMLNHPNIVQYYGIEVHRDKVYIFEEFCAGGSLGNLLEHGRIEDEVVMQIYTTQMLNGLIYLHSENVVHRDIKPDNILLDAQGTIKYVDFGAAKVLAKNQKTLAARSKVKAPPSGPNKRSGDMGGFDLPGDANSLTGTPVYLSPETVKGERRGKMGAMDVWALGCVVLECATGKRPWSNLDNEWAIMFHIGIATKHPPLPEPSQLSPLGIDFIRQCLNVDPDLRPTAQELMEHEWIRQFNEELGIAFENEVGSGAPPPPVMRGPTGQRMTGTIAEDEEEEEEYEEQAGDAEGEYAGDEQEYGEDEGAEGEMTAER